MPSYREFLYLTSARPEKAYQFKDNKTVILMRNLDLKRSSAVYFLPLPISPAPTVASSFINIISGSGRRLTFDTSVTTLSASSTLS